jgi:DNA-binding transcriptional LysR family regulator
LILGPRLGAFLESYPQLRLELITTDHLGDLVAEGFDLAVRFGFPRASTLIARKLLDTRMLTIASPAYLERHGHPKDPHELTKGHHVCIQFRDPETGRPYPWEFHKGRKKLALETEFRRGEFTETGDRSYAYFANSVFDLALAHGWPDASLEYLSHSAWAMEHGIAALILARRVPREDSGLKLQKMIEFAIDFFIDSVVSGPAAHRGAARAAGVRDGSPSDTTAT